MRNRYRCLASSLWAEQMLELGQAIGQSRDQSAQVRVSGLSHYHVDKNSLIRETSALALKTKPRTTASSYNDHRTNRQTDCRLTVVTSFWSISGGVAIGQREQVVVYPNMETIASRKRNCLNYQHREAYSLPAFVRVSPASFTAKVSCIAYIGSITVQGNRRVLDETCSSTFSFPYSRSMTIGKQIVLAPSKEVDEYPRVDVPLLQQVEHSSFSCVAKSGTQPSLVSVLEELSQATQHVGEKTWLLSPTTLQPWEGLAVLDVNRLADDHAEAR